MDVVYNTALLKQFDKSNLLLVLILNLLNLLLVIEILSLQLFSIIFSIMCFLQSLLHHFIENNRYPTFLKYWRIIFS